MTKPKPIKVGAMWELGDEHKTHEVTRPDGTTVKVTGGLYVLTAPGTYRCGDNTVEVTA